MASDPVARMEQGLRYTRALWGVGLIITFIGIFILHKAMVGGDDRINLEKALFVCWTLGPPAWFVLQHYTWPPAPGAHDRFRDHQALCRAIWGGVLAFLAAVVFGRWG